MADRPLYVLPFRLVVGALVGVLVLGLVGGALGASFIVRRVVSETPGGGRLIERTERVTVSAEEALAGAAASLAPSAVLLKDDRGRVSGTGVALTQDGVIVTMGSGVRGTVRVQRLDGETASAGRVRVYPEVGLAILTVSQNFPVPTVEREHALPPGTALAAVSLSPEAGGARVLLSAVETEQLAPAGVRARYPGLARLPILTGALPASFQGAPLVGTDGRVRGLTLIEGGVASVVPGELIDRLVQDFLQHRQGTTVTALSGLRGSWRVEQREKTRAVVFLVQEVPRAWVADLRRGDRIVALAGRPLIGPAPLVASALEAGRRREALIVTIQRGSETAERKVPVSLEETE